MTYDVVVIGAGAAGMMAAGTAAMSGKKTLLIEKMEKAGRKIRITGKGRCNLTNINPKEEFLSKVKANADFFAPSFDQFDNQDVIDFFRQEGVRLKIERGNRVFPESGKAWDIAQALADYATESGAEVQYHTKVTGIRTISGRVTGVKIENRRGFERIVECKNVIIATGGASYPATGSTGDGYALAHRLGHTIEEIRPSLVPFISSSQVAHQLNGLRLKNVNVRLLIDGEVAAEEFGEMEFGTRGIEGAVILRLSRMGVDAIMDGKNVEISMDLKPALDTETLQQRIARDIEAMEEDESQDATCGELLRKLMPKVMVEPFARMASIGLRMPASRLEEEQKKKIIDTLKDFRIPIDDHGTFETAVVTAGGVSVAEVDPETLQSKLVRGLYFAGELLDLDADTGGYNLQIAFSTGRLAGKLKNNG